MGGPFFTPGSYFVLCIIYISYYIVDALFLNSGINLTFPSCASAGGVTKGENIKYDVLKTYVLVARSYSNVTTGHYYERSDRTLRTGRMSSHVHRTGRSETRRARETTPPKAVPFAHHDALMMSINKNTSQMGPAAKHYTTQQNSTENGT